MAAETAMNLNIQPLGDRVLVKPSQATESKRGPIIIPDTANDKPQEGIIVACGKGGTAESGKVLPLDVRSGDRILYAEHSGDEIKMNGQDHLIMRQEDILGILKRL